MSVQLCHLQDVLIQQFEDPVHWLIYKNSNHGNGGIQYLPQQFCLISVNEPTATFPEHQPGKVRFQLIGGLCILRPHQTAQFDLRHKIPRSSRSFSVLSFVITNDFVTEPV